MTQVLHPLGSKPGRTADETFNEEFPRLYELARRAAVKRGMSSSDADDIAQEALARCYARWRTLHDADYVEAWVVRTASNLVVDTWRKKNVTDRLHAKTSDSSDHGTAERLVLGSALAQLPRRQREVMVLRYIDDLHEDEVAEVLGCSVGTVRKAAMRGREALRTKLGDSDFACFQTPTDDTRHAPGDASRARTHGRAIRSARHGATAALALVLAVGSALVGWRVIDANRDAPVSPANTTTTIVTTTSTTTPPVTTATPSTTAAPAGTPGPAAPESPEANGSAAPTNPASAAEVSFSVDNGALRVGLNPVTFTLRNPGSTTLRLASSNELCTLGLLHSPSMSMLYALDRSPCATAFDRDLAPGASLTVQRSVLVGPQFGALPSGDYPLAARFGTAGQSPEWSDSPAVDVRIG